MRPYEDGNYTLNELYGPETDMSEPDYTALADEADRAGVTGYGDAIRDLQERLAAAERQRDEAVALVKKHACDCDEGMCGAIGGRENHKCGYDARAFLSKLTGGQQS